MALNWNIEKCDNYKELTEEPEWSFTNSLIYGSMFVGIPEITKDNYKEFYARYHLMEALNGTFLMEDGGKPLFLTLEQVKRRIGLSTNASRYTRKQFTDMKVKRYYSEIVEAEDV